MVDQELLQAMKTIMKEELEPIKKDIAELKEEIQESEQRVMKNVAILMDADFGPRFNALGEQIDLILEKLPDPEEMETMDYRVSALELSVKKLNKEIKQLKAANE